MLYILPKLLMLTPAEENTLVQRMYAREEAAMTVFYDQYGTTLYHSILRIVQSPVIAEAVLQESLIKIWFSISRYDAARSRLFSWAVSICCHHAIDYLQTRHTRLAAQTRNGEEKGAPAPQSALVPPAPNDLRETPQPLHPMYHSLQELKLWQQKLQLH